MTYPLQKATFPFFVYSIIVSGLPALHPYRVQVYYQGHILIYGVNF